MTLFERMRHEKKIEKNDWNVLDIIRILVKTIDRKRAKNYKMMKIMSDEV